MLVKYAAPPQGGATTDYINWALEVPGCTRAWCVGQGYGPGSVVVYPMFDDSEAAHGGFPQGTDGCAAEETRGPTATGDQSLVAEHIWPVQPVTALVYVAAPLPYPIDVTLMALDPADEATQTTILAALDDMFLARGEIAGAIFPSDIYDAILAVPGIIHFVVLAPDTAVQVGAGQLPIMGALTVVAA
jgi:uncharacterized phage protein gp47/JayE